MHELVNGRRKAICEAIELYRHACIGRDAILKQYPNVIINLEYSLANTLMAIMDTGGGEESCK